MWTKNPKIWNLLVIALAAALLISMAILFYPRISNNPATGGSEKYVRLIISVNETNFNVTIKIFNDGNEVIPAPNWAYTYVLTYDDGTRIELYRRPSNCTSTPINPGGNWTHTDSLYSFLEVKNGRRLLKLPPGKFKLFALYKSPNNPYSPELPYGETASNALVLEARSPLRAVDANTTPVIDGKIEPREWDDVNLYRLSWKGGPYARISNTAVNLTVGLKHDAKYLYILFTLTGIEATENAELRIVTQNYELHWSEDEGLTQLPYDGGVRGDVKFSYLAENKTYIFEIMLDINTYFSSEETSPFNIIFLKDPASNWEIVPIGGWNDGEPGIVMQ